MAVRMPALLANARLLCASGAPITAGTDGGVSPGKPHDVLPYAIEALIRIGMSPTDALVATTSRAAEVCGARRPHGQARLPGSTPTCWRSTVTR